MAEVEFKCKHCGLHYSLICEDPDTAIEYTEERGCPDCGKSIRPLKCDGRWVLKSSDIDALLCAGLIKVV